MRTSSTAAQITTTTGPIVWQARRNRQPRRGFGARTVPAPTSPVVTGITAAAADAATTTTADVESGRSIPTVEATTVVDQTAVVDPTFVVAHPHDPATPNVRRPPTFTLQALCSFCLCCWPLGLVAMYFSWKTSNSNKAQDFEVAARASITAFWLSRLAVVIGILMMIISSLVVNQLGSKSDGGKVMAGILFWTTAFINFVIALFSI